MGPFAIAMLANAGINLLGGARDTERIENQSEIETAVTNANAESERANIMKDYTGVFGKMVSDLGSQVSVFATAGVDKAGTLFNKGLQKHEKAFLDTKGAMQTDLKNATRRQNMANIQTGLNTINSKNKIYSDIAGGLMDSFINYQQYGVKKESEKSSIKNS